MGCMFLLARCGNKKHSRCVRWRFRLLRPVSLRCKPGFLLPVRVLSRLFRRLFLARLADAHMADRLAFFGDVEGLGAPEAFTSHFAPLHKTNSLPLRQAPP